MILNAGKYRKLFILKDTIMNNSEEKKILCIAIDNKLIFSSHITELCKKASQKNIGLIKNIKPT